jgi:hypothetical protein
VKKSETKVNKLKTKFGIQNVLVRVMIPGLKRTAVLLFALLMLIALPLSNPVAEGGETEILLLHTNNVTGHLFPCPT